MQYTVQGRGRHYAPLVRALYILARRAMAKGEVTATEVEAKVANLAVEYFESRDLPVSATLWKWEREEPDLPERLLNSGLLRPQSLPDWLRCHLRQDDTPLRSQSMPNRWSHTPKPVPLVSYVSPTLSPSPAEVLGWAASAMASTLAGMLAVRALTVAMRVASAPSNTCSQNSQARAHSSAERC